MEEKIRNLKKNERKKLEKYTRKLFKYRQKDRKLKRSKIKLNIRRREDNGF